MKKVALYVALLTAAVLLFSSCSGNIGTGKDSAADTSCAGMSEEITTAEDSDETTAEAAGTEKDHTELINYAVGLLNDRSKLIAPTDYMEKYLGNYKISDIEWVGYETEPFVSAENVGGVAKIKYNDPEAGTFYTYTFSSGDCQYTVYGDGTGYALMQKDMISPYYSASLFYDLGMPLSMVLDYSENDDGDTPEDITPDQLTVIDDDTVEISEDYLKYYIDNVSKALTDEYGGSVSGGKASGYVSTLEKDRGVTITVSFRHTLLGDISIIAYQKDYETFSTTTRFSTTSNGIPMKIRTVTTYSDIVKQDSDYIARTVSNMTETSCVYEGQDVVDTDVYTLNITDNGFAYRADISENVSLNGQSYNQSVSTLMTVEDMSKITLQNYESIVPTSKMVGKIVFGSFKSDCPSAETLLKKIGEKG